MAKSLVIVDSCVFIKAFRNDLQAKIDLKRIEGNTAYSVVTQLELLVGANTSEKKEAVRRIFETYYGIYLNSVISKVAVELMLKYISGQKSITVPDCLIAATSIVTGLPILTYNKKDFDFIEGVRLY